MGVRKGVDPKPDGQNWSENRRYVDSLPGYAPAPRGGVKPVNLSTTRGAGAYNAIWRPGFGWKPAFTRAGNNINAAMRQAEQASLSFTNALRATAGLGPIGGVGGGDSRGQKKR